MIVEVFGTDSWALVVVVVLASIGAGAINTLVGTGTLLTFPALLALGVPPVSANITNNIGLVVGSVTGAWGYRRELRGQAARARRLVVFSAAGGAIGAGLLLVLPAAAFEAVVPALVAGGVVLVITGPWLSARSARRRARGDTAETSGEHTALLGVGVLGAGVYGGYFGAAQGVLLIGMLDVALTESLQRVNALKNVLASTVNLVAGLVFVVAAPSLVRWPLVAVVAVGATVGSALGARYGRRLPPVVLRGTIVVVGCAAIVVLVTT